MKKNFINIGKYFLYRRFPDLIFTIHAFWIALIIFSTINILLNPQLVFFHIFLLSFGLVVLFIFGYCPLTKLEEKLRTRIDPKFTYGSHFMVANINRIFKKNISVRAVQIFTILFYILSYGVAAFVIVF